MTISVLGQRHYVGNILEAVRYQQIYLFSRRYTEIDPAYMSKT